MEIGLAGKSADRSAGLYRGAVAKWRLGVIQGSIRVLTGRAGVN